MHVCENLNSAEHKTVLITCNKIVNHTKFQLHYFYWQSLHFFPKLDISRYTFQEIV